MNDRNVRGKATPKVVQKLRFENKSDKIARITSSGVRGWGNIRFLDKRSFKGDAF